MGNNNNSRRWKWRDLVYKIRADEGIIKKKTTKFIPKNGIKNMKMLNNLNKQDLP